VCRRWVSRSTPDILVRFLGLKKKGYVVGFVRRPGECGGELEGKEKERKGVTKNQAVLSGGPVSYVRQRWGLGGGRPALGGGRGVMGNKNYQVVWACYGGTPTCLTGTRGRGKIGIKGQTSGGVWLGPTEPR